MEACVIVHRPHIEEVGIDEEEEEEKEEDCNCEDYRNKYMSANIKPHNNYN